MIPLSRPCLDNAERDAVVRVLESGWLAHGPLNREFEEAFARLIGVEHAVSLNSCTSALHLAIEALGLDAKRRGDVFEEPGVEGRILCSLKDRFDPEGLLNPGRARGRV